MLKLGMTGVSTIYAKAYLGNNLVYDGYTSIRTSPNSNDYALNNCAEGKNKGNIKIGDGPNLSQFTTTGKNKLSLVGVSGTSNDVDYSVNSDGKLVLDGTCSSDRVEISINSIALNGTYTFSTSYPKATAIKDSNYNNLFLINTNNSVTNTVEGTPAKIVIYGLTGVTFDNQEIELQIETGSKATTFEKFTGEQPSPSPDYPQDIIVIKGSSKLLANNKNLLPYTLQTIKTQNTSGVWSDNKYTLNEVTFTVNSDLTIIVNGTASASTTFILNDAIPLGSKPLIAGTYTLHKTYNASGLNLGIRTKENSFSSNVYYYSITSNKTFTLTKNTNLTSCSIKIENGTSLSNAVFKPMLEKGSPATSYIQYKGKAFNITLPTGMFLGKLGTASNYIYGEKDNWKLHSGLGKKIFDGTENFTFLERTGVNVMQYGGLNMIIYRNNNVVSIISNYLKGSPDVAGNIKNSIRANQSGQVFMVLDNTASYAASADAFKTWLNSHNITTYYLLATATDTNITDNTLITQLNNIADNLQTYDNQTIVFTTSENLEPNIQFDYRAK